MPITHHASLKAELPAVTDFDFGDEVFEPNWLQLQDGHDDFGEAAIGLCELVSRRDKRIGKTTPKAIQLTNNGK